MADVFNTTNDEMQRADLAIEEKNAEIKSILEQILLKAGDVTPYPATEEGYIDPSSRFRVTGNPISDFIGRKMGEYLLSDLGDNTLSGDLRTPYELFSKWEGVDDVTKIGEDQLVRSLFQLDQAEYGESRVFDVLQGEGSDVFTVADTELGKEWIKILDYRLNSKIDAIRGEYEYLLANPEAISSGEKDLKGFLENLRGSITTNPDTGEKQFKFGEGLVGDLYIDSDGNFQDYWNIGLDEGEKLITNLGFKQQFDTANLQRFVTAPFSTPPTVQGTVPLSSENKDFLRLAFRTIDEQKQAKDPITSVLIDKWLNEGYTIHKGGN